MSKPLNLYTLLSRLTTMEVVELIQLFLMFWFGTTPDRARKEFVETVLIPALKTLYGE